jgi:hypothetical protein
MPRETLQGTRKIPQTLSHMSKQAEEAHSDGWGSETSQQRELPTDYNTQGQDPLPPEIQPQTPTLQPIPDPEDNSAASPAQTETSNTNTEDNSTTTPAQTEAQQDGEKSTVQPDTVKGDQISKESVNGKTKVQTESIKLDSDVEENKD